MVGLLVIKVVIKWFVYVCKLKKNARLYILNDVSFSINWRDVCSGLDTSRRCSLLWAIWRGRIVSQYTVSLSSVSPTVLCRSLTISSFSFEWFHSVKTCYGCSHIMTGAGREGREGGGGVSPAWLIVFCSGPGWCQDRKNQGGFSDRSWEGFFKIMVGARQQTTSPPPGHDISLCSNPQEDVANLNFMLVKRKLLYW